MLTFKLAFRGLWRHRMRTLFTLSAIAFGHMFLLVFMSLSDGGLSEMVELAIRQGSAGHVVVQAKGYQKARAVELLVPDGEAVRRSIQKSVTTGTVVRRVFGGGLARSSSGSVGVFFSGVEPRLERKVSQLANAVKRGVYLNADAATVKKAEKKPGELWCALPPKPGAVGVKQVLVGEQLARTLKLGLCDKMVLNAQGLGDRKRVELRIVGMFRIGSDQLDAFFLQIPIGVAQWLLHLASGVHQVALVIDSAEGAHAARDQVKAAVGESDALEILSWDEAMPEMAEFVWFKKVSGYVFIAIVIFIVAIGVLNTVFMSVMERTREIGVMRALGTKPGLVLRLVMAEGAVLGVLGVGLGILLAMPILHYLETTGIVYPKPVEAAGVTIAAFKGKLHTSSLIVGSIIVFLITVVAAIPPAIRAAGIQVLRAIHRG
jgi:putative ABC transport system permease protein